jgi:hypothetical protein
MIGKQRLPGAKQKFSAPPCLTLTNVADLTLRASVGIIAKAGVKTTPDRSTGDGAAIVRLIVARTRASEEVSPCIIGLVDLVSVTVVKRNEQ